MLFCKKCDVHDDKMINIR